MSLQADVLADRRRLKRRLSVWRVAALVFALALGGFFLFNFDEFGIAAGIRPHIARVNVSGIIQDDREQQKMLDEIAEDPQVKAVILHINSPGGTTTGGEALYEAIRRVSEKKPVVSVFGTVATSAAYLAAVATDHIVSRNNTITGSVGVIFQWAEVTELMKFLGIKMEEIKSGPLKANPSPFQPLDEAGRSLAQEMVLESQTWFLDLVVKRRALQPDAVPGLRAGSVYTGRRALDLRLVDEIGGERVAVKWLEEKRSIPKDLRIFDWKRPSYSFGASSAAASIISKLTGISAQTIQQALTNGAGIGGGQLDGLVSLWHPQID
jgi:protease-4